MKGTTSLPALVLAAADPAGVAPSDLQEALRAIDSMIGRAEKAPAKFAPGTSHHALQRNRLQALRIAEALTKAELSTR